MPVDTEHSDYRARSFQWQRARDVLAGSDAVKRDPWLYLRRPGGLAWHEGADYVKSAVFFGASARTLEGLVGAIFRKPPAVQVPERREAFLQSVDGRGTPLQVFAKQIVREVLSVGRAGVLVDVPVGGGSPYLIQYRAEDVINWRSAVIDGRSVLSLVVLREVHGEPDSDDPFETKARERYRVLELVAEDGGPVYRQTLYLKRTETGRAESFELVEGYPVTPMRTGEPLRVIPFTFCGPTALSEAPQDPPLLPLVDVNLSHFNTSASLEHGAWWTALPVYCISGKFQGQDSNAGELKVGASTAWQLEAGADAKILEYQGKGLASLEARLERKEAHMAVLGARLLEPQKAAVEAAATVDLRHRGENSLLASIANTCSRGLSRALGTALWWAGEQNETASTVELNRDFFAAAMTAQEVVALVSAWQQGGIGGRTLHYNLQLGERLPEGMTFDEWAEDLEQSGPTGQFLGLNDDDGD